MGLWLGLGFPRNTARKEKKKSFSPKKQMFSHTPTHLRWHWCMQTSHIIQQLKPFYKKLVEWLTIKFENLKIRVSIISFDIGLKNFFFKTSCLIFITTNPGEIHGQNSSSHLNRKSRYITFDFYVQSTRRFHIPPRTAVDGRPGRSLGKKNGGRSLEKKEILFFFFGRERRKCGANRNSTV